MFSQPRGLAFVLNIRNFDGSPEDERKSSEVDFTALQELLTELDYKVYPFEDLNFQEAERA